MQLIITNNTDDNIDLKTVDFYFIDKNTYKKYYFKIIILLINVQKKSFFYKYFSLKLNFSKVIVD